LENNKNANIIKEYKIGNTKIKICDAHFANSTQEKINTILKNCTQIANKYLA